MPESTKFRNYGNFYKSNILVTLTQIFKKKERFGRRIFEPEETYQPNGPRLKNSFKKFYKTIGKI